jgi:putative flippase GtrA
LRKAPRKPHDAATPQATGRWVFMAKSDMHAEGKTALKFAAVGCLGFLVDITVLHLAVKGLGLSPYVARAISLAMAMQVTFVVNGLLVFRCLRRTGWLRQWLTYMGTNGFGNLCNYGLFSGLVLLHWHHGPALFASSLMAYGINYLAARHLVFGKPRAPGADLCEGPAVGPAQP